MTQSIFFRTYLAHFQNCCVHFVDNRLPCFGHRNHLCCHVCRLFPCNRFVADLPSSAAKIVVDPAKSLGTDRADTNHQHLRTFVPNRQFHSADQAHLLWMPAPRDFDYLSPTMPKIFIFILNREEKVTNSGCLKTKKIQTPSTFP